MANVPGIGIPAYVFVPQPRAAAIVALLVAAFFLHMPAPIRAQNASSYNFTVGATQCYSCLSGSFSSADGSGTCSPCSPGYFQDVNQSTACKPCPAGTYNPSPGSKSNSSCIKCVSGTYSNATAAVDSGTCKMCDAGTFSLYTGASSVGQCLLCPAGSFSSAGNWTCTPCPAEQFSSSPGATACVPSSPGYATVPNMATWSPECTSQGQACIDASAFKVTLGSTSQVGDAFAVVNRKGV